MTHPHNPAWEALSVMAAIMIPAAVFLFFALPGVPYRRFLATSEAKKVARAIAMSCPSDWTVGEHHAYCAALDVTVWHANQGYAFKLWNGHGGIMSGKSVFEGGNDGEALWHAFKPILTRRSDLSGEKAKLLDKISEWTRKEFT